MKNFQTSLTALILVGLLGGLGSGCALSHMESGRQLESGEIVVMGSADAPGALYLPRVGGSLAVGLGGAGDLGVFLGTSFLTNSLGASGRVYLGDAAILGVQSELTFLGGNLTDEGFFGTDAPVLWMVTPRLITAATDDRPIYGGGQVVLINGAILGTSDANDPALAFAAGMVGAIVGVDRDLGGGLGLQVELAFSFLMAGQGEVDLLFYPQVSFGINYSGRRAQQIEATQPPPYSQPRPASEPRPAPPQEDPSWEDDDSDVPLY